MEQQTYNNNVRIIVVTGGVISGVGKGVITASIGKIMQEYGFDTTLIKIDPYINYDAGTLRPTEHGEVWVTKDGGEIDQDLGTYERFIDLDVPKKNNITTGQIYHTVIERERSGHYLGQTVQFVPHITDEIVSRIQQAIAEHEVVVIEVGGTIGDYENIPFLFALKSLEREIGSSHIAHVLVSYLPVPHHIGEMKTKPTQQAIRLLCEQGIMPDFIVCRSEDPIDLVRLKKVEIWAHTKREHLVSAPDVSSVYQVPLELERQEFGQKMLRHLGLTGKRRPDWSLWGKYVHNILRSTERVRIAIVGKYLDVGSYNLTDSYISICHALTHAGAQQGISVDIEWIDAKQCERSAVLSKKLAYIDGIIVPGGFGCEGVNGKLAVIQFARNNRVPYLGICYGMQLAAIEYARNVAFLTDAHTTEVDPLTNHPIIDVLPLQQQYLHDQRYGGTMRLGDYAAIISSGTRIYDLYAKSNRIEKQLEDAIIVSERHRHRYEVNPLYVQRLEQYGLTFSGYHERSDGSQLMEYLEVSHHPFFIATQAHPEFKSRLGNPNPLFMGLLQAAQLYAERSHTQEPLETTTILKHEYQL